jgi:hypothetical protein
MVDENEIKVWRTKFKLGEEENGVCVQRCGRKKKVREKNELLRSLTFQLL